MFWKPPGAPCVPFLAAAALLAISPVTNAQSPSVTVYYAPGLTPLANGTVPTASVIPTAYDASLQAYSNVTLSPPAPPAATAISTSFAIPVPSAVPAGASMQHNGSFFGFSVEMSVVNQVLGKNSSLLQVPFLNLMANLQSRVGRINVRVGGNTQETAALVASTPDGRILEKDLSPGAASGTTQTPPIIFTPDLIQMMRNISSFVNVHWFLGVPFNDTNWRLEIIETGQAILGDFLIGMQAGNEPDLYSTHGRRPANYSEDDYFNEFGSLIQAIESDPNANASKLLIAPSVSTFWTPAQALFAGTQFLPTYGSNMEAVAVEHYPFDNCGVKFPTSGEQIQNPQDLLSVYLSHNATAQIIQPYLNISAYIQSNNFPFYMFETNTGSCGGFPGLSDAFVAALWGVDYGMQMAFANFSTALFHIGGQSVSYNPFTPAPTNESTFHEWTVGPIYYSSLVVAEALGATGTAQIIDLGTENDLTPAYAIWENGAPARVLILNFANDASGASQISVDISIPGAQLPSQVDVKYLLADDVTQKGNYTWAGQTFGGNFESDGRPIGSENITQATCGTVCTITVPAPGVALVFLSGRASSADTAADASTTFSTSSVTKTQNTVSVNPTLLADSNGHGGSQQPLQLGSTSQGSFKNAATSTAPVSKWTSLIMAAVVGMIAFWRP